MYEKKKKKKAHLMESYLLLMTFNQWDTSTATTMCVDGKMDYVEK